MNNETFRPLEAAAAMRRLLADPEQTEEAFTIVRAIDNGGIDRLYRRFQSTEAGRRLLRERPSLLAHIQDADALAAMPAGSLGRAYFDFCQREGLVPGGLIDASLHEDRALLDADRLFVADRMRDSHDLFHVVLGCRTDLAGELGVLAFTTAQTGSLGTGFLVAAGFAHTFTLPDSGGPGRRMVREMLARGRRAEWFPTADWEALLLRPLDEVRVELGITSVPVYRPFYKADRDAALAA
ncbi:MAG: ubiquinone biosynthesis protein [Sandaracinaceae bacterium]|nr:ubiquinone biosynthesis protein [Sandaracinaceae bacterium]